VVLVCHLSRTCSLLFSLSHDHTEMETLRADHAEATATAAAAAAAALARARADADAARAHAESELATARAATMREEERAHALAERVSALETSALPSAPSPTRATCICQPRDP
jgi:hypothetical protein